MPKCGPTDDVEALKKCWVIREVGATLYQGTGCTDKKKTLVSLRPADRRIRAAIKDALENRK